MRRPRGWFAGTTITWMRWHCRRSPAPGGTGIGCVVWMRGCVGVWCRLVVWMACWGCGRLRMVVRWRCLVWGVRGSRVWGVFRRVVWCRIGRGRRIGFVGSWRPAACWSWCWMSNSPAAASAWPARRSGCGSAAPATPSSSHRTAPREHRHDASGCGPYGGCRVPAALPKCMFVASSPRGCTSGTGRMRHALADSPCATGKILSLHLR